MCEVVRMTLQISDIPLDVVLRTCKGFFTVRDFIALTSTSRRFQALRWSHEIWKTLGEPGRFQWHTGRFGKELNLESASIVNCSLLALWLRYSSEIESLDLTDNKIEDISSLGEALKHNRTLKELHLRNNEIRVCFYRFLI